MTASKTNSASLIPDGDPLRWFNPEALGLSEFGDSKPTKKAKPKKASSPKFKKSNPSADLRKTERGGINTSPPLVGNGVLGLSRAGIDASKAGGPIAAGPLNFDGLFSKPSKQYQSKFFSGRANVNMRRKVIARRGDHFKGLQKPQRQASKPSRMATVPKDNGVKTPSIKLQSSGTRGVAGSLIRDYQLVATRSSEQSSNPFERWKGMISKL